MNCRKILPADIDPAKKEKLMASGEYDNWTVKDSPFMYLTAELPPPPLFKDELNENIIPQINLYSLLSKFNGETEREYNTYNENFLRKFEITRLPPYIILYIVR